jgi:hypothetical protein
MIFPPAFLCAYVNRMNRLNEAFKILADSVLRHL